MGPECVFCDHLGPDLIFPLYMQIISLVKSNDVYFA